MAATTIDIKVNCKCDIPAYIIDWKWQKDMDAKFCPNCGSPMRGKQDG